MKPALTAPVLGLCTTASTLPTHPAPQILFDAPRTLAVPGNRYARQKPHNPL